MSEYYGTSTLESWLESEVFCCSNLPPEAVALFEKWRAAIEANLEAYLDTDDGDGNRTSWRAWGRGFSAIPDSEYDEFQEAIKRATIIMAEWTKKS